MRLKKFIITVIAISLIAKAGFLVKGKLFAKEEPNIPSDNETNVVTTDSSKEDVGVEEIEEEVSPKALKYEKNLLNTDPMAGETFNGYGLSTNTGEEWTDSFQTYDDSYEKNTSIYYLGEEDYYSKAEFDIAVCSFVKHEDTWGQLRLEVSQDGTNWMPIFDSERLTLLSLPQKNIKADIPAGSKYLKIQPLTNDYFYFCIDRFVIS